MTGQPAGITRADLERARMGIPSRSVSEADIDAVYGPGSDSRFFMPRAPGYRLACAEADSPENEAASEAHAREQQAAWREDIQAEKDSHALAAAMYLELHGSQRPRPEPELEAGR